MKRKKVVFRILLLPLLVLVVLSTGCSNPTKLLEKEKAYGTRSEKFAIFHRIAEADRGLGLRFPGFLVGIEKAYRDKIGILDGIDIDNLDKNKFNSEKSYKKAKSVLGDRKRTFISHIAEYRLESKIEGIPYIKEYFLHNAYEKDFNSTEAYSLSSNALTDLKKNILKQITAKEKSAPYTHIFLYCMGWNTDQQESFRNYNSLFSLLIENYEGTKPFRPLFVGISWPSLWKWKVFKYVGILTSYFPKADDADEMGLIWGNRILRDILIPIKNEKGIPLILIGHSLGARVLTRALFSSPAVPTDLESEPARKDVDLFIGLEGAFSVRRFIHNKGWEGYPYENFDDYAKKFVFTWSEHDGANPKAGIYGAKYIGGKAVYKYSKKFDILQHFTIKTDGTHNNYNMIYSGVQDEVKWKQGLENSSKISIIDASELIYYLPYFKGGNAHNDIYTPGIANFIWDCIDNL